jgi:VWFA-related protein
MLLAAFSAAALAQSDLPSAPSAVLQQQQQKPAPAPQAAPAQPANTPQQASTTPPATAATANSARAKPEDLAPPTNAAATKAAPATTATTESSVPANSPQETLKVPVNEVDLIFTATDKHGHFVKDLTANDVKVLDDKKPVEGFRTFRSETDLPLRVGLLIDSSNSIRERFKFEQEAAIEFFNQIIRSKTDEAFVIGFDTVPEVTQDFTNNTEKLADGVRMLRPGGGTALFDAVYYACRDKLGKVSEGEAVRRAIILVSDGDDNQSRVTREEAIEMAQRTGVIIYAISTNTSGMILRGDKIMERLADQTGGRAFFPFKIEDVANAFTEIQDELRSQYFLAYKPPDFVADGHYRSIDLSAKNSKLHLRARKGYFAPSAQ